MCIFQLTSKYKWQLACITGVAVVFLLCLLSLQVVGVELLVVARHTRVGLAARRVSFNLKYGKSEIHYLSLVSLSERGKACGGYTFNMIVMYKVREISGNDFFSRNITELRE